MGKLHQFGKVTIRLYANDHLPPHFHVLSPEAEALFEIATLRMMAGSLPAQVERQALTWVRANKAVIGAEWNRTNPSFPHRLRRSAMSAMPRIRSVSVEGPAVLGVTWQDCICETVNLLGWIATGDQALAPLKEDAVFATARLGQYGASVEWGDEDDDLAIDAYHLHQITVEQRLFRRDDIISWQTTAGLSNQEAAGFLGLALSTWNAYKAGTSSIPAHIGMLCRAASRDPLLLQAHYRPRVAGRPRKTLRVS